jgi:hypothetical protein
MALIQANQPVLWREPIWGRQRHLVKGLERLELVGSVVVKGRAAIRSKTRRSARIDPSGSLMTVSWVGGECREI